MGRTNSSSSAREATSVGGVDTPEALCLLRESEIEDDADAELVSLGTGGAEDFSVRADIRDTMISIWEY